MTTVATYPVSGMTCAHCVAAVGQELQAIPGVTAVEVDLRPGGHSQVTVTSDHALADTMVAAAVDEAGYELAQA